MSATHYNALAASSSPNTDPAPFLQRARRSSSTSNGSIESGAFLNTRHHQTLPRPPLTAAKSLKLPRQQQSNERQPLLEAGPDEASNFPRHPPRDVNDEDDDNTWKMWLKETKVILRYTAPVFGTQLLEQTLSLISIISIGHLSTTALAGVTLGFMTCNVTGLSILLGFVSALDSILPAAWTSNPPLVGLWSLRMGVLSTILLIPILAMWFSAEPILLALRQEPEVAHYASEYLRWLSIGLPAYSFNAISRRYLQSQGLMHIPTTIVIAVVPLNIFLNWLLVWGPPKTRLGFIGAPLSTAISFNAIALITLAYIALFDPRKAWHPLTKSMFSNLGILVKLGFAGVGQLASEWWAWEFVGLATSLLGSTPLASQSILVESSATLFQAPYALSVAASVRIGNHLGSGLAHRAKVANYVSLLISLVIGVLFSIILLAARNHWALIFNNDPEVRRLVAGVMPILALFQVFDGLCAVTSGVLRSKGQQGLGAALQFVSYYIVGLPFGLLLTFHWNAGLPGLWSGLAVALIFGSAVTVTIILRTDWDKEVDIAKARLSDHDSVGIADIES